MRKNLLYGLDYILLGLVVNSLFLTPPAFSSTKTQGARSERPAVSVEYGRSSLTFLLLDSGRNPYQQRLDRVFRTLAVSDKFNDHNLEQRSLSVPGFVREEVPAILLQARMRNITKGSNISLIYNQLINTNIANGMLAKWWTRKADGTFGVELLQARGAYDATDAEVVAAQARKRGFAALEDAGENLINKSYIIVFDIFDVKTMEQHYDEVDQNARRLAQQLNTEFKPTNRNQEGYRAKVNAHLFRLDYNDSIRAVFFQEMWIDPEMDTPETKAKKRAHFDNFDFPIQFVTTTSASAQSAQSKTLSGIRKSDDQLFSGVVDALVEEVLFTLSKEYEDFRVKTSLFDARPPIAKIGLKEGLWVDQRYFVYEFQLNPEGEKVSVRKGVIRATNEITDNRKVATGETVPSRFYQTAGRRLDAGMLLQQRNDMGVGIAVGAGMSDNQTVGSGFNILVEINFSQFLGRLGRKPRPGIKFFADISRDNMETSDPDMSITTLAAGFGKDLYFLRNAHITPFIGAGYESVTPQESGYIEANGWGHPIEKGDDLVSVIFATTGLRLGINILHNLQLLPSVAYNLGIGNYEEGFIIDNEDLKDAEITLPYELQLRKGGLQTKLGVRMQF
ncbi:MAG TPA: hypothetical protein VLH16_04190 [Bacteroidales bacterium]|nr:hypothetical protein [Bacteroidales bacterium]